MSYNCEMYTNISNFAMNSFAKLVSTMWSKLKRVLYNIKNHTYEAVQCSCV